MSEINQNQTCNGKKEKTVGVHVLRHDLRLADNEALLKLCFECDEVYVLYCFEKRWLSDYVFGHVHLGEHRFKFLEQALLEFQETAIALHLRPIYIKIDGYEDALNVLTKINPKVISYELHYGVYEQQQIEFIKNQLPDVRFIEGQSNYLLYSLPFEIKDMPNVFSPFRRKVEKNLNVRETVKYSIADSKLSMPEVLDMPQDIEVYAPNSHFTDNGYTGGESEALKRLNHYFYQTDNIAQYKETRNGLDGWDFSSRFSAFLASGCISPAQIYEQLKEYEQNRVKNDSTYWLFFELLWREFFHLQLAKHKKDFFKFAGIQNKSPDTKHDENKFKSWIQGNTGYEIVDACMKQIAQTGFMSNRGRQLVASCFVHELGLDWRWGASYFEQMLVDFDVASNYGNWQYLAGVGSDPRGHRQFNLEKQTDIYDPKHRFIDHYLK